MVNTLRILGLLAVLGAAYLLIQALGLGSLIGLEEQTDEAVMATLTAPGVVERFQASRGGRSTSVADETPPLVRNAEIFASIINPPPPLEPVEKAPPKTGPIRPQPPRTTPKFTLVGTASAFSESFAYIRLDDGTYQWVRQGDEIGHLVVKEIKPGSIVCWEGDAEVEMVVEPVMDTASLLEAGGERAPAERAATATMLDTPVRPATGRITGRPAVPRTISARPLGRSPLPTPPMTDDQVRELDALSERVQTDVKNGEDFRAAANRRIAELRAARVSAEEAEDLEYLGETLSGDDANTMD